MPVLAEGKSRMLLRNYLKYIRLELLLRHSISGMFVAEPDIAERIQNRSEFGSFKEPLPCMS